METMRSFDGISREICSFLEAMMKADGQTWLNIIFKGDVKKARVSQCEKQEKYGFLIVPEDGSEQSFCIYRKYGHDFGILRGEMLPS